jgi:hypothetical protein
VQVHAIQIQIKCCSVAAPGSRKGPKVEQVNESFRGNSATGKQLLPLTAKKVAGFMQRDERWGVRWLMPT